MRYAATFIAMACALGCSSRTANPQHIALATLRFDIPADWQRTDTSARGSLTALLTPRDNERHESLAIIRDTQNPALAGADAATLERLLAGAQRALPGARASTITPIPTAHNLSGWRIEVDFVPAGLTAHYQRIHATLVDAHDRALVHVLYTAKNPDLDAFNLVLGSIRHEEG